MKISCLPGPAVISVLFALFFTPFDFSLGLSFLGFTLLLACAVGSTSKLREHFRTRQFALRVFANPSCGRVVRPRQTLCQRSSRSVKRQISPTNSAKGPVRPLLHKVALIERTLLDER